MVVIQRDGGLSQPFSYAVKIFGTVPPSDHLLLGQFKFLMDLEQRFTNCFHQIRDEHVVETSLNRLKELEMLRRESNGSGRGMRKTRTMLGN